MSKNGEFLGYFSSFFWGFQVKARNCNFGTFQAWTEMQRSPSAHKSAFYPLFDLYVAKLRPKVLKSEFIHFLTLLGAI